MYSIPQGRIKKESLRDIFKSSVFIVCSSRRSVWFLVCVQFIHLIVGRKDGQYLPQLVLYFFDLAATPVCFSIILALLPVTLWAFLSLSPCVKSSPRRPNLHSHVADKGEMNKGSKAPFLAHLFHTVRLYLLQVPVAQHNATHSHYTWQALSFVRPGVVHSRLYWNQTALTFSRKKPRTKLLETGECSSKIYSIIHQFLCEIGLLGHLGFLSTKIAS